MTIENGRKIKIEYEGKLDSGEVFDSSERHGQPLEFTIGEGKVIPGFENAIKEMEEGQEKEIKIESKDAYGERKQELIQKVPKQQLPEEAREKVKSGSILGLQTPQGNQVPVKVTEVTEENITIDLNHPLAGENLNFKVKILEIQ
jgi:FKBP-type peptidyl-prolyl cis-trans isomerase 2